MNERDISFPLPLKTQYQTILLAMCMLHLEFASGGKIGVNCHSVSRAIALEFPEFTVVDGCVARIASLKSVGGDEVLIRFKSQPLNPIFAKISPINHSWLVWKPDERFILETWPLGGVPGAAPPVLIYQDQFSLVYTKGILTPGTTEDTLREDVERFHSRFKQALENINKIHYSFGTQKAA